MYASSVGRSLLRVAWFLRQQRYFHRGTLLTIVTDILQYIYMMPNLVHLTLTPSIILKVQKFNNRTQTPVSFGTIADLHYAKRVSSKYEPTQKWYSSLSYW